MACLDERGAGVDHEQVEGLGFEGGVGGVEGEDVYLVAEQAQRGDHILRGGVAHERNTVHTLSFPMYFPCKTFGLFLVYSPGCDAAVGAGVDRAEYRIPDCSYRLLSWL